MKNETLFPITSLQQLVELNKNTVIFIKSQVSEELSICKDVYLYSLKGILFFINDNRLFYQVITSNYDRKGYPTKPRFLPVVQNAYNEYVIPKVSGHTITFSNNTSGYYISEKEHVAYIWSKAIRLAQTYKYGDVRLYYNGVLLRTIWNAQTRISERSQLFPYLCFKYPYPQ